MEFKQIDDKITGDYVVYEHTELNGSVIGSVTVEKNIKLILNGTVMGSVYLKENSEVIINGTVQKDVANQGGKLEIYGVVGANVMHFHGELFIDDSAVVRTVLDRIKE